MALCTESIGTENRNVTQTGTDGAKLNTVGNTHKSEELKQCDLTPVVEDRRKEQERLKSNPIFAVFCKAINKIRAQNSEPPLTIQELAAIVT